MIILGALEHIDTGGHLCLLLIDFSSEFNTIIPSMLVLKLRDLGLGTPICNWLMDFLTGRPQVVTISGLLAIGHTGRNPGGPPHQWAMYASLPALSTNPKIKELIMDFRNNRGPHSPIILDGALVEICFRFLGLQIRDDLAWTHNTGAMLKKCLYPLRCLRKCSISTQWLMNFYRDTIECVLFGSVTMWFGNTTAQ